MKILITGAAGFLGLHLANYAKNNNLPGLKHSTKIRTWQVKDLWLLDITPFNKSEYPKNCHFIKADVRNSQFINSLIEKYKFDYIIHAAAALPLWKPKEIFDINVNGTKNLLKTSLKHKIKRFVFISSTAVYGVPKIQRKTAAVLENGPPSGTAAVKTKKPRRLNLKQTSQVKYGIGENDPLIGVGPYGESKIQAEKICEDFRNKGLIITVIRPKTFVGTHRLGVFEILFDWIKDGKKIPVIGSGNNHYQLLDVDDLVEVIYLCLTLKDSQKVNNSFNVGSEKFGTVREDLEKLFDYAHNVETHHDASLQKKSSILPTPAFLVKKLLWLFEKLKISPLYQWVYDTADHDSFVSINRLIDTLNWHPKYSNADALIKAYQWYLDNYQEIKSQTPGITHTVGWDQGILGWIKKFL
jgi:nucleoside-diphosphate-sugar epimerase